jgi:two-component system KDP operon response regulator KdpE
LPSRFPSLPELARILVIEDERPQQIALEAALTSRGYDVDIASTAARALRLASVTEPDLVLLDLGLPDADGIDLCRHLRSMLRCPIIVVSADSVEHRIVAALDLGADDYVVKPYLPSVLMARIRVALRHAAATAPLVQDTVLRCGDVIVDVSAHQVQVAGEIIDLQARAFALLTVLIRNEGKVLTYRMLSRALDGVEGEGELNALRVLVSKLRKQLGTGPRRPVIVTELNVGYRLSLPVED